MSDNNNERELELLTISNIMKTENGRNFVWRCLQNCTTYVNSFDTDAAKHAFNAGKRSHGLWLESEIKDACFDNYLLMIKENGDV